MDSFAPRPAPRLVPLITLALGVAIAASLCVALWTSGDPGVTMTQGVGGKTMARWVPPDGPAWSAGVRPGDTIVNPARTRQGPAQRLVVRSGDRTLVLEPRALIPQPLDVLLAGLGLCLLLLGAMVRIKSPDRGAATAFWRMSLAAGAALGFVPAGIHGVPWALALDFTALRLFGPALLALTLVFPSSQTRVRRPWLLWLPALLLLALYVFCWWQPTPLFSLIRLPDDLVLGGSILATCARIVFVARHRLTTRQQAELHYLAIGLLGGILPFVLFTLLPLILTGQALLPAEVSILAIVLLPLSVSVAIVRAEFLGIPSLLRRRTLHVALAVTHLAGVATVLALLTLAGPRRWGWSAPASSAAAAVLTALGCATLWPRLRRLADGLVLHDVYDTTGLLLQMSDDLSQIEPRAMGPYVAARLGRALDLRFVLLLTAHDQWSHSHPRDPVPIILQEAVGQRSRAVFAAQPSPGVFLEHILGVPILFLPIPEGSRALAVLCLGPKRSGDCYTDQDRGFLGVFGRHLGVFLHEQQRTMQLNEYYGGGGHALAGTALPEDHEQMGTELLTRLELLVLSYVDQGMSNKEIALRMERQERTVEKHLTNLFRKLGAHTRTEAVLIARRRLLLPPS